MYRIYVYEFSSKKYILKTSSHHLLFLFSGERGRCGAHGEIFVVSISQQNAGIMGKNIFTDTTIFWREWSTPRGMRAQASPFSFSTMIIIIFLHCNFPCSQKEQSRQNEREKDDGWWSSLFTLHNNNIFWMEQEKKFFVVCCCCRCVVDTRGLVFYNSSCELHPPKTTACCSSFSDERKN